MTDQPGQFPPPTQQPPPQQPPPQPPPPEQPPPQQPPPEQPPPQLPPTQQPPASAGPAVPPGYGPPAYPPTPGALGKPRGIGISILLFIVTLGIYGYVWVWKTHDEIKRHSGVGVGGPVGFLIYFVFSPVTFFLLASEVRQMLERAGRPSRVKGTTGLWILLPIAGPIVWFVKVQGQLNEYWRSLGAEG